MLWLVIGGIALFLMLGGLRAFERASVTTVKSLLAWVAALAGLSLTLLLVLSGRGPAAFVALSLLYPLAREWWRARRPAAPFSPGAAPPPPPPPPPRGGMSRAEAFEVLGLAPGADEAAIQLAYRRLMRTAHPDSGGSDWLAARINQARDVLLGGSAGRRE